jgi:hypothetical protein
VTKLKSIAASATLVIALAANHAQAQLSSTAQYEYECYELLIRPSCEILSTERQMFNDAMASWDKLVPMLYVEPTQLIWDNNKHMTLLLIFDNNVVKKVSDMIDANGRLFFQPGNSLEQIKKNILAYLMGTKLSAEAIQLLMQIDNGNKDRVSKKLLATMLGNGMEPAKVRMMLNEPTPARRDEPFKPM